MRQIFWVILIMVAVIFGAAWYINRSKTHAVNSGDVFVRQSGSEDAAKSDAPALERTQPSEQTTPEPSGAGAANGQETVSQGVTVPATDSISRNPPNGMIFAGRGKYQLYRQGDITWRLNTDSGQACVLFATDAEWRKARVFQRGCKAS